MNTAKIRHDALTLFLKGVRLPLTVTEAVLKRGEDTTRWAPTLAFEKMEAGIKDTVGNLVHDDVLVGMARLQRAEVTQREQAAAKRVDAEATRDDARRSAEDSAADVERQREQTEQAAEEREQRLDDKRRQADKQVAQKAARSKAAARKQAAARQEAIDTAATKAEGDRLRQEADSLHAKQQAVAAQGEVLELDRKVKAKKAARRAG